MSFGNLDELIKKWKHGGVPKQAFCPYCNGECPEEIMDEMIKKCNENGMTIIKMTCDKHNMEFRK